MLMSVVFTKLPLVGLGFAAIGGALMLLAHGNADVMSAGHDCIVAGIALVVVKSGAPTPPAK